VKNYKKKCMG